ncbi:MAG: hypothetical protein P4L83_02045 [Nevskia sp.]|nr:hypothetical protein [Nevskia sp.]
MRILVVLAALLAGCAGGRISDCTRIAGPGWSTLAQPPPNGAQLLGLENMPSDSHLVWLAKGSDHLLACNYAHSLVTPGCGGSSAYEFVLKDGRWSSRGQLLDECDLKLD